MKRNRFLFSIGGLLLAGISMQADALQKYQFNELERIEGVISVGEINRIKIEGDRIKEIIGLHKGWQVESDGKNGQMFIRSLQAGNQPAIFTIITEKGKTQDIKLMPKNSKGEVIIIETTGRGKKAISTNSWGAKHKVHDEIVEILRATALEAVSNEAIEKRELIGLEASLFKTKKIGGYVIETWQIKNTTENDIELTAENFSFTGGEIRAIGLETSILEPTEVTQMYVVRS